MSESEPLPSPNWRRVLVFTGITYALDWGLVGVLLLAGVKFIGPAATVIGTVYMIVPAIVVIVLARKWQVSLGTYGLRVPRRAALLLAPLVPMLITALTVIAAVALGFGDLDLTGRALIERMQAQGQHSLAELAASQLEHLPINVIVLAFLSAPVAGFTINGLFGLGEELGWRGLLQHELAPLGFARASALIGAIWGLWHAPLILLGHNFPAHPRLGVLVMIVACIPLGIVFSWLALRAQTVIAAAVAHGTFNALAGVPMMTIRGGANIEILQLGYAGIAATALVAAIALLRPPEFTAYTDDQDVPEDEKVNGAS